MTRSGPAVATLLFVFACGGVDEAPPADGMNTPEQMAAAAGAIAPITTPVALTERDMQNFVGALEDLATLGDAYRGKGGGTKLENMGAGFAANAEAMAILRRHDFADAVAFQRVAYSVGTAMGASEMEGRTAEMAAARAKMEAMKSSMSEEQYKMMMQSQEQSMGMMTDQPPGNVALVKAWKDRIKAAAGKD